jgi:hypothetical protein
LFDDRFVLGRARRRRRGWKMNVIRETDDAPRGLGLDLVARAM